MFLAIGIRLVPFFKTCSKFNCKTYAVWLDFSLFRDSLFLSLIFPQIFVLSYPVTFIYFFTFNKQLSICCNYKKICWMSKFHEIFVQIIKNISPNIIAQGFVCQFSSKSYVRWKRASGRNIWPTIWSANAGQGKNWLVFKKLKFNRNSN